MALILVVMGIVSVGYYLEFFRPPRELAGQVRDVRFTMGDLVDRIRVLQGINRYQGGRVDLSTVPFEYLQDMIQAEIVRQAAPGLGFSVTDDDIDQELRRRFRPVQNPNELVDEGQLDQEYENALTTFLTSTKLSEDEYRRLVEEELLRQQLSLLIDTGIPAEIEQVEVAWIRMQQDGPADPDEVRNRLVREDFGVVAAEVGTPDGFTDPEGYVGWVPQGAFPELDDILFGSPDRNREALPQGEISDPYFSQDGVYIIHQDFRPGGAAATRLPAPGGHRRGNLQQHVGRGAGESETRIDHSEQAVAATYGRMVRGPDFPRLRRRMADDQL